VYGTKLKVWQVFVAGAVWIAIGIVLALVITIDPPDPMPRGAGPKWWATSGIAQILYALRPWITVPIGIGLYHVYAGWGTLQAHRRAAAEAAAAAHVEEIESPLAIEPKPRPSVPRQERAPDDGNPFRAPPQPAPLALIRANTEPPPPPIVPGDPDDKPTLLT
jgi:hypothetical protein